jgi:hypothetical protein
MSESPAERFRRIIKARDDPVGDTPAQDATTEPRTHPTHRSPFFPTPPREGVLHEVAEEMQADGLTLTETGAAGELPILQDIQTPTDARRFLERLRGKTLQLVQDYTAGIINRRQFEAVYRHYQRQRAAVEKALIEMPGSGAWRAAAVEGHTSFLRQQHAAQIVGYALFEYTTGEQLNRIGELDVDPATLKPLLDSLRSGRHRLFHNGLMQTQATQGRWLCLMPGRYSALILLFSAEPATIQMRSIADGLRDFEQVNEHSFARGELGQLTYTLNHLWAFEQGLF